MRTQKTSGLEQLLYQTEQPHETGSPAPSSATLLVSLFLILITFFVILNNHTKPDAAKRKVVLESMQNKFRGATNDLQTFGSVVQPKVEEFTIRLQRLLGNAAIVESTVEGDKTRIIFDKETFFYPDETEMRSEKMVTAKRTGEILRELQADKNLHVTIIMGLESYERDKKKLFALKNAIGLDKVDIGLSNNSRNQIILVVSNE